MFGEDQAGEISFYDELGVENNASAEEIRDAFRALARMLHPDQQTDPQLKEIAERQMRKLNRVYRVLSDPERRRAYDELLDDQYPRKIVQPVANGPLRARRTLRVGAALLAVALLIWLMTTNRGARQSLPAAATPGRGLPARADSVETSRLRADLKSAVAQRDAAIRELQRLRDSGSDDSGGSIFQQPALAPLPTMTELPASGSSQRSGNALTGHWSYVKPAQGRQNPDLSLYPPEFIEATITQVNGVLRGNFRSRYQIVDRAISPDVNFSFAGPAAGAAPLVWTGPGGAKGEIALRLLADNKLRVEWSARELGNQQGLSSGKAVLTRRSE